MKKSTKYGLIGSGLSGIGLFLLLWLVVFPGLPNEPKEEEGLIVSFGNSDNGSGKTESPAPTTKDEPSRSKSSLTVPTFDKPTKTAKSIKQDFITQTDKSLQIAEQKEREKLRDQLRKEQVASENLRLEAVRQAAEKSRKEQAAIAKANSMNGMFGNNNSSGSGTGTGESQQGNPVGKGSSGGNSWSLNGRSLTGRLVSPKYDKDVEGKVTVNIRVNENGNVTSAVIGSPTTISDAETRNAAKNAATNTRFTGGNGTAAGSITYNFRLK